MGNKRLREQQPQVYWIDALCVLRPGDSSVCLPETLCVCVCVYMLCFCSAEHVPTSSGSSQMTFFFSSFVLESHTINTSRHVLVCNVRFSCMCFISFGLMCWHKYSASKGFDGADVLKCHSRFVGLNYYELI